MRDPMAPLQETVELLSSSNPPWWAQPRYAVGIVSAIAAALVWFLMTVVASGQHRTHDLLQQHANDSSVGATRHLRMLEQICLNTAGSDLSAIARCQAVTR